MKKLDLALAFIKVPLDFILIFAAGILAYLLRYTEYFITLRPVTFNLVYEHYVAVVLAVSFIWVGIFAISGLYAIKQRKVTIEISKIVFACSTGIMVGFAIIFFRRELFESRFIVLAAWLLAIVFVIFGRILIRALHRMFLYFKLGEHRIVLIGKTKTADKLIKDFKKKSLGYNVVHHYDHFDEKIAVKIIKSNIDEIILADPSATKEEIKELLGFTEQENISFKYSADILATASANVNIETYGGIPIIEIKKTPLEGWGKIYKRIFDIVISLLIIIITLPIQIIIAVAIFIESPGRILFSRLPNGSKTMRVGERGKPFHYFKFRSMIKDARKLLDDPDFKKKYTNIRKGTPLFKIKKDPRVLKVGRIIRRVHLDELPEFYLVFLGRMSLIGPRPHLPEEVANYKPHQKKVLAIKPGITGMAQISGSADLDFDQEVRIDNYYIENWSPLLDLWILLKTPFVVIFGKGAY